MKNFKKLLILTTVLSSMALGAGPITPGTITNPGDDISGMTDVEAVGRAGVPMEVRVNVIGQGPQLVLVDETGTLIENLTFDHGNKLLAEGDVNGAGGSSHTYIPQKSQVEKIVILKRTDGKAFNTESKVQKYTGNFLAMSNNVDDNGKKHQMTLTRLGNSDIEENGGGVQTAHTMKTALDYESQNMDVDGTRTEIRTTVVSTIAARTPAKAGLYVGTGMFVGSLTVAQGPAGEP